MAEFGYPNIISVEIEEKKRLEELAPDKEKLLLYADRIRELTAGKISVQSEEAKALFFGVINDIADVEDNFRARIDLL